MAAMMLRSALAIPLAATLVAAYAQEAESEPDLTLPPTIESPPGEPRLEPPPEERDDVLEAVVTGGQNDWRLPDLGSSLRQQREAEAAAADGRIEVGFLGLYDPDEDDGNEDFLSPDAEVMRGVGFLQIFRFRIGGRQRADD
jgi:hypothetical protein